jgi:hypothetical protein
MTFDDIYNRIIPLWGDKVSIEEGEFIKDSGILFRGLSEKWDKIEKQVGYEDTFGDLMVWTMFQVFHEHAKQSFSKGVFSFNPTDIDIKLIESKFYENLQDKGWEKELSQYKRKL